MDHLDEHAARAIIRTFGAGAWQHADSRVTLYEAEQMKGDAHMWRRIAEAITRLASSGGTDARRT